jgi:uncharacterized membrane protein
MQNIQRVDEAVARHTRRKCEYIASKTVAAFLDAAKDYGTTFSADEILAIGTIILMETTIKPLERLSDKPLRMRNAAAKEFMRLIKQGSENE